MPTVLKHITRRTWGKPSQEEIEHDNIARKHFVKHCESCPTVGSWHEGPCAECHKNPYNMVIEQ